MSLVSSLAAGAFAVGLLGGVHCVGMCGGIVAGLTSGEAQRSRHLTFNAGRVLSYAVAGSIAGSLGGASLLLQHAVPIQITLYVVANVLLVGLGLYLVGWSSMVTWLERPGQWLWRQLQPAIRRNIPIRDWRTALSLGALWGWVPCGLVYSVLASALLTGSALNGALVMLAFGLGTLPNLLILGIFSKGIRTKLRVPAVRWSAGALVVALGVFGLSKVLTHSPQELVNLICAS